MSEQLKDEKSSTTTKPYKIEIVWFNAIGFLALHAICLYGLYIANTDITFLTDIWTDFLMLMSGIGLTIGGHRYYAHRSFEGNWFFRIAIIVMNTIAGQNCLYIWVRDHRQHHKYTDTDADPHNSKRGFFFSHIGWLMVRKHPEVFEKGKSIDLADLENDELLILQKRYYTSMYVVYAFIVPVFVPVIFWNEKVWNAVMVCYFYRYVVVLNLTWAVNSWAHSTGYKPYNRRIAPVESVCVSVLSQGEGWHNYHHCFPWDYKASEYGFFFNNSSRIINALERFGMAYNLKEASEELVKNTAIKHGDGSHPLWGYGDKEMSRELYHELNKKE